MLTTTEADRPAAVYAVHNASAAAVATFCAALRPGGWRLVPPELRDA
ncbi:hypothetical protein L1856_11085 [Streptomyces sp. Tue 6430]|nr:hypothetical protein [Streptomyces sp. Tue 6430]